MSLSLRFDAINEPRLGQKWQARWNRSWPAYKKWFLARGGAVGPDAAAGQAALAKYMPELLPTYHRLCNIANGGDLEARFLSTWCPPPYLGGCSIAAHGNSNAARLVRNYDLSPDLNEGLLFKSSWCGPHSVMGMIEFLWGLSDGINDRGLSIALAFGGSSKVAPGFGITTIVRYVLETCDTVAKSLAVLAKVPSHMAYNLVLMDASGRTASVEMAPGGGMTEVSESIATNHQHGFIEVDRPEFTATLERRAHLDQLLAEDVRPEDLAARFLDTPLFQSRYDEGFGTLFTAEYDPRELGLRLIWREGDWRFRMNDFVEGTRLVRYQGATVTNFSAHIDAMASISSMIPIRKRADLDAWLAQARTGSPDWAAFGSFF